MAYNWFQRPLRLPKIKHSVQDQSHNFKTSTRFGLITPVGIEEVVPSDRTVEFRPTAFMRLSPLLYPIMHQVHARIHTFEVPLRILIGEKNYEDWLNAKFDLPSIDTDIIDGTTVAKYDIFTSLLYPRIYDGDTDFYYHMENGLDFLALLVIWRDWYADSQINAAEMTAIDVILEEYQAAVTQRAAIYRLIYDNIPTQLNANLRAEYFTSARPEPQLGDPVNLTSSPTKFSVGEGNYFSGGSAYTEYDEESDGDKGFITDDGELPLTLDLTIRELWRREQIQRFWDISNTFGSRTREWLAGHMGIIYPDNRLMIPRILQSVDKVFTISEVLQTSETTSDSPLGAYAGKGTLAFGGKSFKHTYLEHGLVVSLLSVVPEVGWASSRPRYQFKKNVFDFAIPEFNNIGFQEIYKGEIYGKSSDPKGVFGYVPRYSEYRAHPNRCGNAFADDQTLIDFHMNILFDRDPGLNGSFISGNQNQFYRIFSDMEADMDSILVDCGIIHTMYRPVSAQPSSLHL